MAKRQFTEQELWLAIRQERVELTQERRRLREIDERLDTLAKGENILEGGL